LQAKHLGCHPSDTVMRSISGTPAAGEPTSNNQGAAPLPASLRVAYQPLPFTATNAPVLAAIRFGVKPTGTLGDAVLTIDVGLEPLQGPPLAELWFASGPVVAGQWSDAHSDGFGTTIRYAHDEHHLFAVLELDERAHGGILLTAERAYAAIQAFQEQSAFRHLLRMWNYMDAINEGAGDMERYRQFCVGRGRGLGTSTQAYPSASALGRHIPDNLLQVFWLAGKVPGKAIENPRQVSAYHYPRVHGPVSPTFARALVAPDETVLISGTASIVGHVSQHHDDAMEQLEETVRNLAALMPHVGRTPGSSSKDVLKIYVRDREMTPKIAERLRQLYPNSECLFVAADVCRRELLVEIEAVLAR
jgi:chorismate lyase/3-hydroxybenzoate synthase